MSNTKCRVMQNTRKRFIVYCEGDTDSNCLAKFVIIDSDKAVADPNECERLKKLIDYCQIQNRKNDIPIFLILCQPDFEYVACTHCENYNSSDYRKYIEKVFGYKDIDKFKAEKRVYPILNTGTCSFKNAITKNVLKNCVIQNKYSVNKKAFKIKISDTNVLMENMSKKATNLVELFDIIEWE